MKQFKLLYEQVLLELTKDQETYLKRSYHCEVVDRVKVDKYELVLLTQGDSYHRNVKYCLGLDREGADFTTYSGQMEQLPLEKIGFKGASIIADTLKQWIQKYDGDIIIEVFRSDRIKKYKRLLDRFQIKYKGYYCSYETTDENEMNHIVLSK